MAEDVKTPSTSDKAHRVVNVSADGKVTAMGRNWAVVSSGTQAWTVRVVDLKEVETILTVRHITSPATENEADNNITINGNHVGGTVYGLGAGTTLVTEVVAVGTGQ